jgi:para-nitrobenzyl esterase
MLERLRTGRWSRLFLHSKRHFIRRALKIAIAFVIVPLATVLLTPVWAYAAGPIVATQQGKVQGFFTKGIAEFLGVPYAAPPLSTNPNAKPCSATNLRWCPPVAHAAWKGVRQATVFGPTCAQNSEIGVYAGPPNNNEDCLYLNVFTPAINSIGSKANNETNLPVIFWDHGGGDDGESNDYDGSKLAFQGNVIVVTVNYRLNNFGMMAHPALDSEGHLFGDYGILDNQFALHWVRDNIAAFGGNPHNVTISGQSFGGWLSTAEMLSPLAKGLFQRAALQSGPVYVPLTPLTIAEQTGINFAVAAGCGSGIGPAVAACLRAIPAATIEALLGNGKGYYYNGIYDGVTGGSAYGNLLIADGQIEPTTEMANFTNGNFNHVPILTGTTENEGTFFVITTEFYESPRAPLTEAQFEAGVQAVVGGNAGPNFNPPPYPAGTVAEVLAHYPPSRAYPTPELQWAGVWTDVRNGCYGPHMDHILASQVPIYAYEFRDQTAPNYFPPMPGFQTLAYHTGDIQYLFSLYHGGNLGTPHVLNAKQEVLSDQLVAAWSNFAYTGNPNGKGNFPWPRYTPTNRVLFTENIAPEGLSAESEDFFSTEHQCAFWNTLLVYGP